MTFRQFDFDFQSIDKSIENFLKDIPRDLVLYLKESFEDHLPFFTKTSVNLDSVLVIDSSSVIASLIAFEKTGDSLLNKIIADPFLQLHAPSNLVNEVERGIEKVSKKLKLNIEMLKKNWSENIFPKIIIDNASDSIAISQGYSLIGDRDASDVPFVALNFQLGAQGIITKDKDIIEQPVVKTWSLYGVEKLITVFRKGSFSFFVFSQALPSILTAIFQIGVAILRVMFELLCNLIEILSNLVISGIDSLSKAPDWVKVLLACAGVTISLLVIFNDDVRNAVAEIIGKLGETLAQLGADFQNIVSEILVKIAPLVQITLTTLSCLFEHFQKTIEQLNTISIPFQQ